MSSYTDPSTQTSAIRTSVSLPNELKERVELAARNLNISTGEFLRLAARAALDSGVGVDATSGMRRYPRREARGLKAVS